MARKRKKNPMSFDDAVIELAKRDGAEFIVTRIPGVWEVVSEFYNNDAIDLMREENPKPQVSVRESDLMKALKF